ncbi:MAG: 2-oxoacid:ferredoxin oxidoreductase subunit beta [Elusimicrobiota bacterium]
MSTATATPVPLAEFKSKVSPDWCPGCGDFGVLSALQKSVSNLGIQPKDLMVVSGIGCSSNLPGFIRSYGFHSLHGRSIGVATGMKLANPDLNVVVTGGDGDGFGIGVGHFIHAMRRNVNLTYIVMNNQIYGLTTGQASPTTHRLHKTKSTPNGNFEFPFNPEGVALMAGASFVARGFSGDGVQLASIMEKAIAHKGFSLVVVMSPCVTYNKLNTYSWFRERVYKLDSEGHDINNFELAIKKSMEWDTRIPLGIFYETDKPVYEEMEPAFQFGPPAKQKLGLKNDDWNALYDSFR